MTTTLKLYTRMISDFSSAVTTLTASLQTQVDALVYGRTVFTPTATLTQVNAAIAAANAGTGAKRLLFRAGTYTFSAALTTITANNVVLEGEGDYNGGTTFNFTTTTGNDITISGAHSGVRGVYFATTARKTSGYSVKLLGFRSFVDQVRMDYVFNGVHVADGATEARIGTIHFRYLLGTRGVLFGGTAGARCYRLVIDDIAADNPLPLTHPAPSGVKTWATATAYSLNDMTLVNSKVYQCTTAGTSAGSGSGPSGIPGTGGSDAFSTTITDGTCVWKFVYDGDLKWIVQESYAYSLVVNKAALINGYTSFVQADAAATGTSYPTWATFWDLESDHPFDVGVLLERGEGFDASGPWISSSMRAQGMVFGANHRGEITVRGHRVFGNAKEGILHNAGPDNVLVTGGRVGDNSVLTADTYDGVAVAADATHFSYQGNFLGDSPSVAGNNQRYSLIVNTGASDYYVVADNIVQGSTTGGVSDGGSGVNKRVANNV